MDYEKQYKEETGKTVYMDLMGTACLTVGYVEWLKKELASRDKKLKAMEKTIQEYDTPMARKARAEILKRIPMGSK